MKEKGDSDFRTFRGYQLINQKNSPFTPAMEDYLEMTYRLCLEDGYTRVGRLSQVLNVKPSSASRMIYKLVELGYLQYDPYESIWIKEKGKELGAYLLERHKTIEQFLKLIGSDNPLEETELIEHSLSPFTVAQLSMLIEFFADNESIRKQYEQFRRNR